MEGSSNSNIAKTSSKEEIKNTLETSQNATQDFNKDQKVGLL